MDQTNMLMLQGRIITDPVLKVLGQDKQVCKFRMVHSVRRRTEGGTYQTVYEAYYDVEVWDWKATKVACLPKACPVVVVGKLWQDEWNDRETGAKRSKPIVKADAVYVDPFGVRDIESGTGYLTMTWGNKAKQPPPVPSGLEQQIGGGGSWDETPF